MSKDDGGQVYPVEKHDHEQDCSCHPYVWTDSGISRRDWLAGLAMQGMLAKREHAGPLGAAEIVAVDAYYYADAVIEQGKK